MKNKKSIIALLIVAIIGIVGLTLAYFSNSDTIENTFTTKEYANIYTEEFVSPDNWLPGDVTDKTVVVENTGQVDQAVRISFNESWTTHNNGSLNGWIHSDGIKSNHTTEEELSNDERVAILNLANTSDWTKVTENGTDYYYYNYKLAPGESTSSFLESVTFNSKTKLDDTCVTTEENGVKTVTCNSSGDDYDNAKYKLTFTIETVQYNKYSEAWGTSATIAAEKQVSETFAQHIINNANAASIKNYTDGVTSEAYTFNHEATEQTGALTDYRYIGNTPNNYVYFNCTDESDTSTCEVWRVIGVFSVEDENGNSEERVKLVRGNALSEEMAWDTNEVNEWSTSTLNTYLNGTYFTNLSSVAQSMTGNAKYYLGGEEITINFPNYGNTEEIYSWERGIKVFDPSNDPYECNNTVSNSGSCVTRSTQWIGKVALIYPSDEYMVYENQFNNDCLNDPSSCNDINSSLKNWMFNGNRKDNSSSLGDLWLISPSSEDVFLTFLIDSGGALYRSGYERISREHLIRPTLYLKTNTYIVDGDGSSTAPYQIELR